MSVLAPEALAPEPLATAEEVAPPVEPPASQEPPRGTLAPYRTGLGAALSVAAAAWMVSGMFRGVSPHVLALTGVLIGSVLFQLSCRLRNATIQLTAIPIAVVAGIVSVAPEARGGTSSFFGLLENSLHSGGLLQTPLSFDPGWRFILIVLFTLLAVGAPALAIGVGRPRLGVIVPLPLTMGAALVQPTSSEVPQVAVSLALIVFALTLVQGAHLAQGTKVGTSFELGRLTRATGVALFLAALVVGLNFMGFLFPHADQKRVIPPQRPMIPPSVPDTVLFTVHESRTVPIRLGTIDTYNVQQQAWLLPSYDPSRLDRVQPPATLPGQSRPGGKDISVDITIQNETGNSLPELNGAAQINGLSETVAYDPDTGALTLADRPLYTGLSYQVLAPPLPTGQQLAKAGHAPPSMVAFLVVPPPPTAITDLLSEYARHSAAVGATQDPYDCVQYARGQLYGKVVAAGAGNPVDVPASRVTQMLNGSDASPYEIVAAEAMLARWCGVPARIGYGFYGGVPQKDGSLAVHPINGAMWLEAYFQGYDWQALVGVPPHAKASTSSSPKNPVNVTSVDRLQLITYVPIRHPSFLQLFEIVDWYVVRVAPAVGGVLVVLACYPWALKRVRRRLRRQWGHQHGFEGRIIAAYAEFRDQAHDLTIGDPGATPVGFLDHVEPDHEHEELAWLVTRALWGDLRRDLVESDAAAAETLASSVTRRLDQAQSLLNRVLARIARSSLREPYTIDVPNLWFEVALPKLPRGGRRRTLRRAPVPRLAAAAMLMVIAGCAGSPGKTAATQRTIPSTLAPAKLGVYTFTREKASEAAYASAGSDALVSAGRVYSIHHASGASDGALEVAVFKPQYDISDIDNESEMQHCIDSPVDCPGHEIFLGLQHETGTGQFTRVYFRNYERAYEMTLSNQRIYMWFPPQTETMAMLILSTEFTQSEGDAMFHAILDWEHGHATQSLPLPTARAPHPASGASIPQGPQA